MTRVPDPDTSVSDPPPSLRRNFSWTFAGNTVAAACQWGMMVALARLGSPEIVGRFALGFAVTAPVFMFANLQLRAILATDAKREFRFADFLGLRLITMGVAVLAVAAIALGGGYRWETAAVILAIGVAKLFDSVSDIICGLLQQHERMDRVAVSAMAKGITSLVALMLVFQLTGSLFWGAAAFAAAFAGGLVFYDAVSPRAVAGEETDGSPQTLRPRFDPGALRRLTALALPLGFVMMLISLNLNAPRCFVERFLGERDLGIFAAMAYLTTAGVTVISALSQSAIPRLAKHYAAGNADAYRALLAKLMGMGILMGGAGVAAAVFAGPWILGTVYGAEYARHSTVLVWISVASGIAFVQWFLDGGMTVARCFRVQVPLFALGTAATCLGCLLLVPRLGLVGAALAMVTGNSVLAAGAIAINIHIFSKLKRKTSS